MAKDDLIQAEADALIGLEKRRVDDTAWNYPGLGGGVSIPLVSVDGRERFVLDLRRGRIDLAKGSYQNRGRRVVPLVRSVSAALHTTILTARRSDRPIFTSTAKDTATSGPSPCPPTASQTCATDGGPMRTSWGSVR